jgi:hypothetical protein
MYVSAGCCPKRSGNRIASTRVEFVLFLLTKRTYSRHTDCCAEVGETMEATAHPFSRYYLWFAPPARAFTAYEETQEKNNNKTPIARALLQYGLF